MNASTIVDPSMTLEEKLKAIDEAMKKMQDEKNAERVSAGLPPVMIDPADALMCESCQ